MRPARAALFDLGNVVFRVDFARVFAHWARADGRTSAGEVARRFAYDDAFARFERGDLDIAGYAAHVARTCGIALDRHAFAEGWNGIYGGVLPGIDRLLAEVAERVPIYAFTNTNALHQRAWRIRFLPVLRRFERVFASHELGLRKPDPSAYRAICARIGLPPGRIAFVDDHAPNIAGARAAGLRAERVRTVADVRRALIRHGVLPRG